MIKRILHRMYGEALYLNDRNVVKAAATYGPFDTMLDVGCWDGKNSLPGMKAGKAKTMLGIEVVPEMAAEAAKRGIKTEACFADRTVWPYADNSIDCITSNQVIEHLTDLDFFFAEAQRVLKPGGVLITSTNNLSSWHNIIALLFGWAPFDLTNSSTKVGGIGNPLALHRGEPLGKGGSWTHKCIYTARWLFDWQGLYGLEKMGLLTSGYYPLPGIFGRFLQNNAAFIVTVTFKAK